MACFLVPTAEAIVTTVITKAAEKNEKELCLKAVICCQNPTLNPALIVAAINLYLPEFAPDFTKCIRMEILDTQENIFR